ncbi:erg26, C-3 sterol dehydrogenase [Puccinia graminis f. sp. tritici]|uniref:Erg26, C-3 sterol dehydrogenase n=1 Tax=Puccinia graminis f. sp. tritici TaxID=56615 RepID=A0A5B0MSL1_PUCGR|nr:erg26, C-3 sterol dehydrogenase [Puccinia graminis f. sp. tritici]
MAFQPKKIIVIGGEGFLGHNLVQTLHRTYPDSTISSLDLTKRFPDCKDHEPRKEQSQAENQETNNTHQFIQADLTSLDSLLEAFQQTEPELVFHTASPWSGSSSEICEKVNIQGTLNTIAACLKFGVQRLVYTSSAGVVFNGNDLINVDERLPVPKIGCDPYNTSKARAEAIVLEANGKDSLLTCAIRPAGIFGPGDRQAIPGLIEVLKTRKHGVQIGGNTNLFDWTYVDNVVHAHILAAEKLDRVVPLGEFSTSLSPISKTVERRNLLTSGSKAEEDDSSMGGTDEVSLVDLSTSSKDAESYNPTGWIQGHEGMVDQAVPAKRHRWDQWAPISTQINYPDDQVRVAGEAFFVTGGEPVFFWDFARAVWHEYAAHSPHAKALNLDPKPRFTIVIPTFLALFLASLAQLFAKLTNSTTLFTPEKVRYTSASKYHNIEKARVVLGYEPLIGIHEGIQRAVQWYISNESLTQSSQNADKKND